MTWNRVSAAPALKGRVPAAPEPRRSKRAELHGTSRPRRPKTTTPASPTIFATLPPRTRLAAGPAASRCFPTAGLMRHAGRAVRRRGPPSSAPRSNATTAAWRGRRPDSGVRRSRRRARPFAASRHDARLPTTRQDVGLPPAPKGRRGAIPHSRARPRRAAAARARATWEEATAAPGTVARGEGAPRPCSNRPAPAADNAGIPAKDAVVAAIFRLADSRAAPAAQLPAAAAPPRAASSRFYWAPRWGPSLCARRTGSWSRRRHSWRCPTVAPRTTPPADRRPRPSPIWPRRKP